MKALGEKFVPVLSASGLFCLTLLFFSPLQIYLTNTVQLPFSMGDVFLPLLVAALVLFTVIGGILLILPQRAAELSAAVLLALGLLLYFQGNWILWDYGTLDGRPIDWDALNRRGWIDGAVWVVGLLAAVVIRRRLVHYSGWIAGLIVVIQIVNLSVLWAGAAGTFTETTEGHKNLELYRFSKDKNVLLVILDTLQSDVVQDVFDHFPDEVRLLDGFTFYRNTLGGFPTTFMSVPLIMSGKYFQNDIEARTFLKSVTETEANLPHFMKEHGFRSHLIGTKNLFIADESNSDISIAYLRNIEGLDIKREILFLVDLAAFRTFPHFIKKRIYNDQKWFLLNRLTNAGINGMPPVANLHDLRVTENFVRNASADGGAPVFKYMHFWAAHPPIRLNENLDYVELPRSRANFMTYTRAALALLGQILTKLKEIGTYDNTLIVVTGDHGAGIHGYVVKPTAGGVADELVENTTVEARIKSGALPAVLVKKIGSRGVMETSEIPITIGDIPAAVAGELDLPHSFPGAEFLSSEVDPNRKRYFYYHQGFFMNAGQFFDGLTEHRIIGHSWLDSSWERTDMPFPPGGRVERTYRLGERIRFDLEGDFRDLNPYGFSVPGKRFTWTDRYNAGFRIRLEEVPGDLVCRIKVPLIFGANQGLSLWLNSTEQLGDWFHEVSPKGGKIFEVTIPATSIRDNQFVLEFLMPNAKRSPKDYGMSNDVRRLGIGVEWVEILPKE